jgi:hypothetical protein
MSRFRDKMRNGRKILHRKMGDPAVYFQWSDTDGLSGTEPTHCRVRIHENFNELGDQKGTNFSYAEVADNSPRAIFMLEEVDPKRRFLVRTAEQVYEIDTVDPVDDITVTAYIIRYSGSVVGMPEPESDT